jgi:hypothetical protein
VALGLLDGHAHTCVIGAEPGQQDARTAEMMPRSADSCATASHAYGDEAHRDPRADALTQRGAGFPVAGLAGEARE